MINAYKFFLDNVPKEIFDFWLELRQTQPYYNLTGCQLGSTIMMCLDDLSPKSKGLYQVLATFEPESDWGISYKWQDNSYSEEEFLKLLKIRMLW